MEKMCTKEVLKNAVKEAIEPVQTKVAKIEKHIESSDLRTAELEEIVSSGNMTTQNDTVSKEIEKLKAEISSLKSKLDGNNGKVITERCKTAIFGGYFWGLQYFQRFRGGQTMDPRQIMGRVVTSACRNLLQKRHIQRHIFL